jgi:hypothetical protein
MDDDVQSLVDRLRHAEHLGQPVQLARQPAREHEVDGDGPGRREQPPDLAEERLRERAAGEDALTLPQMVAWDTTAMGRLHALGYDTQEPRRRYAFRNRHGFSDVADGVFNRLWTSTEPTWADVDAACKETATVSQPA